MLLIINKEDLNKLPHSFRIMFAVFCAKQVIHLVDEKHKEVCLKAIEVAEGFIEGKYSREVAASAARSATAAANTAALSRASRLSPTVTYILDMPNPSV